jgi:NitT/TauT family transport system ATP-binding protein
MSLRGVGLSYARPDGRRNEVLAGIDIDLLPNEVLAIIGPSGSGKSSLLRLVAGLTAPSAGEVFLRGAPLREINPSAAIVFQSFALYPWMTVKGNIEAALEPRGLEPEVAKSRLEFAVRAVGLEGFEEAYPKELTGESLRQEILDIWYDAERNPSSVMIVSHDIREVALMADRIAILSGTPATIRTILANPLPRPRDPRAAAFARLVDQIHEIITSGELPDESAAKAKGPLHSGSGQIVPIPRAHLNKVLGLLETLENKTGRQDIYDLCAGLNHEFGDFLEVVKAAELLGFVTTPESDSARAWSPPSRPSARRWSASGCSSSAPSPISCSCWRRRRGAAPTRSSSSRRS